MNNLASGAIVGAASGATIAGADPMQIGLTALIGALAQIALGWISQRFTPR